MHLKKSQINLVFFNDTTNHESQSISAKVFVHNHRFSGKKRAFERRLDTQNMVVKQYDRGQMTATL
jgi:hypothetical protein